MELSPKDDNGKTVFMFAGNMGVPQNLDNVIAGYERAALPDAELWLVGGGVMLEPLREKFGYVKGVKFCGRQPRAEMPKWFAQSDVLIISLTDKYCQTLPAKFQSYIKTGRPLFGILNGEANALIKEFNLGCTSSPDDLDEIAAKFKEMTVMSRSGEGKACGERAKALSEKMFNRERSMARLFGCADSGVWDESIEDV